MKILLLLLLTLYCHAQEKDYTLYHQNVNKAEELFFMKDDADSALAYYDKVFADYDFIFVKDLVNAAQVAIFAKKPYMKYIEQGFAQGLKLSHLKKYPLFSKSLPSIMKDKKLEATYEKNRKKYLSRINLNYLNQIYKMAIADQRNKTLPN